MEAAEVIFQAPMVLRILCYLSAMGFFIAEVFWLFHRAYGYVNPYSLKAYVQLWFLRVLLGCAFLSLGYTVLGQREAFHFSAVLPELSVLCLVSALYLLSIRERSLHWQEIVTQHLPRGVFQVFATFGLCCVFWGVAFILGWAVVSVFSFLGLPDWVPFFVTALLWNAPLVFLFLKMSADEHLDDLKFHDLLWPVLFAYFLIMLPDIFEHIGNHPNIARMIDPTPVMFKI